MRNRNLATDHVRRAEARLRALDVLFDAESWADVLRDRRILVISHNVGTTTSILRLWPREWRGRWCVRAQRATRSRAPRGGRLALD